MSWFGYGLLQKQRSFRGPGEGEVMARPGRRRRVTVKRRSSPRRRHGGGGAVVARVRGQHQARLRRHGATRASDPRWPRRRHLACSSRGPSSRLGVVAPARHCLLARWPAAAPAPDRSMDSHCRRGKSGCGPCRCGPSYVTISISGSSVDFSTCFFAPHRELVHL